MKILFLVTNDWYFWSHRLSLAHAVRDAGGEVFVMTHLNEHKEVLESEGLRVISWESMSARNVNPFREAKALWEVVVTYRRLRPDLTHHIGLKPALYGGLAGLLSGNIPSIQTIAGLGYLFTNPPSKMLWLRWLLIVVLWTIQRCGKVTTIFQNPDDRDYLISARVLNPIHSVLIRGSGINLNVFLPIPEPTGVPVVVLPARMLWDKGVGEFVEAATQLRSKGIEARFVLVGRIDHDSAGAVTEAQLHAWAHEGKVEWWGYAEDIRVVFARSNIICLPSYREGLPKVLLEACACGRAVITANSPGCREVVWAGENGLLVPPKDADSLARAIRLLLDDTSLRARMARRGREIIEQEFNETLVIRQTLDLYRKLMRDQWPDQPTSPECDVSW